MRRLRRTADAAHAGRLDKAVAALFAEEGLSRREARRLIGDGAVYVDGRRLRVTSRSVRAGQEVEVVLASSSRDEPPVDASGEIQILYEDADLIAVDKPSGLPCQATPADAVHHLEARVRSFLKERDQRPPYLALHHRLDRGTSGVMLFAKQRAVNKALADAFREQRVAKVYRALVTGTVPDAAWTVDAPLGQRPHASGRILADPVDGRPAETFLRVLEVRADVAVLEAVPRTGRMHQIRVHLADAGLPVIGDTLYGGRPAPRLLLHAARLELDHPRTGERLVIESPLPEAFLPLSRYREQR